MSMVRTLRALSQRLQGAQRSLSSAVHGPKIHFSQIAALRKPSAIRALTPLAKLPGMISLGAGLPNPDAFPFQSMECRDGKKILLEGDELNDAMQYSPTTGLPSMVKALRYRVEKDHSPPNEFTLLPTTGSQEALSRVFEMLVDPGTPVAVESPTYPGALASLRPLRADLLPCPTDANGIIPEELETLLKKRKEQGLTVPHILYTIPTGQNPSGATTPLARKEKIYEIAQEFDMIILEDDPYYYIRLDGKPLEPSYLSLDNDSRVLRFDSFSKVLSSGLRLGYVSGPKELVDRIELHMQVSTLHTSGVSQAVATALFTSWKEAGWLEHMRQVQELYTARRDTFMSLCEEHLSGLVEWSAPQAGMFVWMKLVGIEDSKQLIQEKALEHKILLVPGQVFDPLDRPSSYARASFSTASEEDMKEAVIRLADLLREQRNIE